ncbi:MAG: ABC transporter ATP-binding protein [Candidatus Omnitrophica bacterium]|nr:ABC transporter ATP-binding protein [Candidatus Omnitrophota bacterium]MDD5671881.1 ABC transporter ATP-binding protein [Candidatus Omnitrophota bacterium]
MPLIRVVKVTKSFREESLPVTALDSVSIEVEEGAFLAVCGPSGSGKTTLLNLIGCLDKPTSGNIYLEDDEISALGQKELTDFRLRKIGFIFQDYNLIPTFTAIENVEYVLWLQGVAPRERRRLALEVCERFGVAALAFRRPWQLSRGQQQRIAVARAVVHRPRLVLGDELTANLDHKTGQELMAFLKELNKEEGVTFLYATHDPVMMGYADKIIRLYDGRILE